MIGRADIDDRVRAWGLREDVVEKDYVLGWVLWSIGVDPVLGGTWIFKGGTCLKKCYNVTSRFSEDLDFTVVEDGRSSPTRCSPPSTAVGSAPVTSPASTSRRRGPRAGCGRRGDRPRGGQRT